MQIENNYPQVSQFEPDLLEASFGDHTAEKSKKGWTQNANASTEKKDSSILQASNENKGYINSKNSQMMNQLLSDKETIANASSLIKMVGSPLLCLVHRAPVNSIDKLTGNLHCSQCFSASFNAVSRSRVSPLQNTQYDLGYLKKAQAEIAKIEESLPQAIQITQVNMNVLEDVENELLRSIENEFGYLQKVLQERKERLLGEIRQVLQPRRQENDILLTKSLQLKDLFSVCKERSMQEPKEWGSISLFMRYVLNNLSHGHLFKLKLEQSNSYLLNFQNKQGLLAGLKDYGSFIPVDLSGSKYLNLISSSASLDQSEETKCVKCRKCGNSFMSNEPVGTTSKSKEDLLKESDFRLRPSQFDISKLCDQKSANSTQGKDKPLPLLRMIDQMERGIFADRLDSPQYSKEIERLKEKSAKFSSHKK